MARLIILPSHADDRGSLSVLDEPLPFAIRRVYFLYGIRPGASRGGHRHLRARQALICVHGSCEVRVVAGGRTDTYRLEDPTACLLLEPADWHELSEFSAGATVAVLASEPHDPSDLVDTPAP